MVKSLPVQAYFPVALFPREEGAIPAAGPAPVDSAADPASAGSAAGHRAEGGQAGRGNC